MQAWKAREKVDTVKPVYNSHPWEMARWPLYTGWPLKIGQLCRKYKVTENFGKLSSDHDIQGDRYIQGHYIQVWQYYHLLYLFLNLSCSLLYWSSSSFSFCCAARSFCSAIHTCHIVISTKWITLRLTKSFVSWDCYCRRDHRGLSSQGETSLTISFAASLVFCYSSQIQDKTDYTIMTTNSFLKKSTRCNWLIDFPQFHGTQPYHVGM